MSHFIANSLTINKDFTQFKVKGGDNNCFPRSNSWSGWIEIEHLLSNLVGGSLQFGNSNKERFLMLDALTVKFRDAYVGDLWGDLHEEIMPLSTQKLNRQFLAEVKREMKDVNNTPYQVTLSSEYVYKVGRKSGGNRATMTRNEPSAKLFGKYQAKRVAKMFEAHNPVIIEVVIE